MNKVEKILIAWGNQRVFCSENSEPEPDITWYLNQICQLIEPKTDYNIGDKGLTTGNESYGTLPKPDESRLLTDYKLYFRGFNLHISDAIKKHIFEDITKAQRDLTASILEAKYAADMEHLSHLVDDVISLEEQVKSKDAEIAKLNQKLAINYVIDLVKRAKGDFLGLPDGEQEFIGQLAKELWDIKKLDAECQERVIAELDNCFLLAPNDDSYLRILVKDTLEYIRTGKRRKERQEEKRKESNR